MKMLELTHMQAFLYIFSFAICGRGRIDNNYANL